MEKLLTKLANQARSERIVACHTVENNMKLLAYPVDGGVLVGMGVEPDRAHLVSSEAVVRKRSESMERFGAWLPTRFTDGSWYVVRRVSYHHFDGEEPVLSLSELIAAQELLT